MQFNLNSNEAIQEIIFNTNILSTYSKVNSVLNLSAAVSCLY